MTAAQTTYLDRILADKRADLASQRRERSGALASRQVEDALAALPPARSLEAVLREGTTPRIIAEFKRASPSQGPIREGARVEDVARAYVDAGAVALSILTDRHFDGSYDDLRAARACVDVPLLCKDFILEKSQLIEARMAGADAALLIVAALPPPTLRQLIEFAKQLGLEVLCEAHDEHECDRAMTAGARIVGGNARDLRTFEVDLERSMALRKRVPDAFTYVAESGISSPEDIQRMLMAGVDAMLVGTSLMRAPDPGVALRDLLGATS